MTVGLRGLYPVALLPLRPDLSIAARDFVVQIQHLARAGVSVGGVIVNEPSGDGAGLSPDERGRVLELARAAAPLGFAVIACVQAGAVAEAVAMIEDASTRGADAALVYPLTDPRFAAELSGTTDGPLRVFTELTEATDLPLIVAQAPADGDSSYSTEALVELARPGRVVGIVNAVGDPQRYAEQYEAVAGAVPMLVAADTPDLRAMLLAGAEGAALSISNLVVRAWADFVADVLAGRSDATQEWFSGVGEPLLRALDGAEASSSAWIKHALVLLGQLADGGVRPPLSELTDEDEASLREALAASGLLPPVPSQ